MKRPYLNLDPAAVVRGMIDALPYLVTIVIALIGFAGLIALIVGDVVAGHIIGSYLTKNFWFGLVMSFATTGLIAASVAGMMKGVEIKMNKWFLTGLAVVVALLMFGDIYLDSLSPDIMRFGRPILVKLDLGVAERMPHNVFRALVAGVSLVGETVGTIGLMYFPVLKEFFNKMVDVSTRSNRSNNSNSYQPKPSNNQPVYRPANNQPTRSQNPANPRWQNSQEKRQEPTYHPVDSYPRKPPMNLNAPDPMAGAESEIEEMMNRSTALFRSDQSRRQ